MSNTPTNFKTIYQIDIICDKQRAYKYNLEILIGQKPETSIQYITDYLNDVHLHNIDSKDYYILMERDLFIIIFGTHEYMQEYFNKTDINCRSSKYFQVGLIEPTEQKNSLYTMVFMKRS